MPDHFHRDVIISVSSIVLAFAVLGGILFWLGGSIGSKVAKIAEGHGILYGRTRSIEALAEFRQSAPEIKKYGEDMSILLPAQDGILDFRRWLDDTARTHRVVAHSSFEGNTVPASDAAAGSIGFSMDATGSYGDIQGFFHELEETSKQFLLTLNAMTLLRSGPGTEDAFHATAQGQMYFR